MNKISEIISVWFQQNKRNLAFRETKDPYLIWVSEIIMQQTRIIQGMSYYNRFVEIFPDIDSLSRADEAEVMKLWQGLGYYSRARNMIYASQQIMNEYQGKFPDNYSELLKIKGIGKYTAAAIASISFNQPVPVLDGNVLRFMARLFGIHTSIDTTEGYGIIRKLTEEILDHHNPGDFNQAMMEFGALICKPQNPGCTECVLKNHCIAFRENNTEVIPVRSKSIKIQERFFNYLIIKVKNSNENLFFMRIRNQSDIWRNLYEFPLIETRQNVLPEELIASASWKDLFTKSDQIPLHISKQLTHKLTHRKLMVRFYEVEVESKEDFIDHSNFQLYKTDEIFNLPVSRLIENQLFRAC